jgi:hypothetical protein
MARYRVSFTFFFFFFTLQILSPSLELVPLQVLMGVFSVSVSFLAIFIDVKFLSPVTYYLSLNLSILLR